MAALTLEGSKYIFRRAPALTAQGGRGTQTYSKAGLKVWRGCRLLHYFPLGLFYRASLDGMALLDYQASPVSCSCFDDIFGYLQHIILAAFSISPS